MPGSACLRPGMGSAAPNTSGGWQLGMRPRGSGACGGVSLSALGQASGVSGRLRGYGSGSAVCGALRCSPRPNQPPNRADEKSPVEFGAHVKAGGWRLGLLVARNVQRGHGTGSNQYQGPGNRPDQKVSASKFAELAQLSDHKIVLRYLDAWDRQAPGKGLPPSYALSVNVRCLGVAGSRFPSSR